MFEKDLPEGHDFNSLLHRFWDGTIRGKVILILRFAYKKSKFIGDSVTYNPSLDYPIAFAKNINEFKTFLNYMKERGLLQVGQRVDSSKDDVMKVTINGLEMLEREETTPTVSKQVFVAMSFDDDKETIFTEGIQPLSKEMEFDFVRVDTKVTNGKICDKIVADIKKSRFVIADVTGQKPGVYFEGGLAMGLGLQVIWTCNKTEKDIIHFDTRQYNHIFWEDLTDLREQLKYRIRATIC